MNHRRFFRGSVALVAAVGLVIAAADSSAAPRPRPRPKPGVKSGPKLGPKPAPKLGPKPAVKPGPKPGAKPLSGPRGRKPPIKLPPKARKVVIGRPVVRTVVPARYRPGVLVRSGGTIVLAQTTPSVVVASAEQLAVVPAAESVQAEAYRVVDVADDYTVTLLTDAGHTPVRLLGVDAPLVAVSENQPGQLPEAARHFARNLLLEEFVYLQYDPGLAEKDADGNPVAYLYRAPDKLLVNLELIRQGYGLAAEGYAFEHQEAFEWYQQKAQTDRKGIWESVLTSP